MHYTAICNLSSADMAKFKLALQDFIAQQRDLLANSENEELYAVCLDFTQIGNS